MAKLKTRKCIVCGAEYEYCNNCRNHSSLPSWMAIYHDENCKNIMNISTEYMAGNLTKTEAKSQLDCCDLANKNKFKGAVATAVNEILSAKKPEKVVKEAEVNVEVEAIAKKS